MIIYELAKPGIWNFSCGSFKKKKKKEIEALTVEIDNEVKIVLIVWYYW